MPFNTQIKVALCFLTLSLTPLIFALTSGRAQTPNKSTETAYTNIREVDFLNRTYRAECADDRRIRVKAGEYSSSSGVGFSFSVKVVYGDLTADNQEEAVVITDCDGAAGSISKAEIYSINNGKLVSLAKLEAGNRGNGGIREIKINNGLLTVERNFGPAACCAVAIEKTTYRLKAKRLSSLAASQYYLFPPEKHAITHTIQFNPGKSSTEITDEVRERVEYLFSARKGQSLEVDYTILSGDISIALLNKSGELLGITLNEGFNLPGFELPQTLPTTGNYKLVVNKEGDIPLAKYKLEISIK